ncbi:MAG: FtsX-like permease family protein, partial [Cellulosilyticaceae bacterium]
MYFKLAFNNVKKSFRDYTIYFLTLTLSVCVFYIFNAIESQKAMMIVSEATDLMMQNLASLVGYLSIFVAVVLGFLILYANKFLIRRRKKELGLYMTLGMEKGKISLILVLETLMIGICSLIVGLVLGIFLSQALSVFTAQLFGAQMVAFQFVFSQNGLIKSLVCFVIIYGVTMLFNVVAISKCQLIDLLYASKKNEAPVVKNLWVSVVLFVVAIVSLVTSYSFIINNGLMNIDAQFYMAFIFAFVGTFLFFMSLSGFLLKVMQSCKKLYFNELNMFIFRQINSKINTTYVSMTFVCLMLAVTIVTLSSGIAMNQSMTNQLEKLTPYDVSFVWKRDSRQPDVTRVDIQAQLRKMNVDLEAYSDAIVDVTLYQSDIAYGTFYVGKEEMEYSQHIRGLAGKRIEVMALSDYNKAVTLQGGTLITLGRDEYALNCIYGELIPILKDYMKQGMPLNYGAVTLRPYGFLEHTLYVQLSGDNKIIMVVADELLQKEEMGTRIVNLNYRSPELEERFVSDLMAQMEAAEHVAGDEDISISAMTREMAYDASVGLSAIMTYLTVYIAIILLITSAAILALQQLTESEDNKVRYDLLRKLGVDEAVINRTLYMQIAIYFMVPLLLAVIHGIVGIYVANTVIVMLGEINLMASILFTAFVFVV